MPFRGFIVPYIMEISARKNVTIFEGCHFPRFDILIPTSFWKIETQNIKSDPCIFNLVKLGTISPAAYFLNWENIERSQAIQTAICRLSKLKIFYKGNKVFKILTWKLTNVELTNSYLERFRKVGVEVCATIPLFLDFVG